jgi:hypothetical protein
LIVSDSTDGQSRRPHSDRGVRGRRYQDRVACRDNARANTLDHVAQLQAEDVHDAQRDPAFTAESKRTPAFLDLRRMAIVNEYTPGQCAGLTRRLGYNH